VYVRIGIAALLLLSGHVFGEHGFVMIFSLVPPGDEFRTVGTSVAHDGGFLQLGS